MERLGREKPLPPEMQGRWVAEMEPEYEMVVTGGDVFLGGGLHEYIYRVETNKDGEILVSFESRDDVDPSFEFNSLNLGLFPDGTLGAFGDDIGMVFVRPGT